MRDLFLGLQKMTRRSHRLGASYPEFPFKSYLGTEIQAFIDEPNRAYCQQVGECRAIRLRARWCREVQ